MAAADGGGKRKTWVVVGASRGIGHELVEQVLARGDRVFATVRKDLETFWPGQKDCQVLKCDVADDRSIDNFVNELAAVPNLEVDYVIINAGVLKFPNRATETSFQDWQHHLNTNTIGPIVCAQKLLKTNITIHSIVFMSSDSGSVQMFRKIEDGFAAYAASKAALNHGLRHMAAELERKGDKTIVWALHPGEVLTDMVNDIEISWEVEGEMTPKESVTHCLKVIESKGPGDSGTFWTWENKTWPW